ncbi:MAG TPA: hypothetical protein H9795_05050 [Candidatus Fournierella merdigallinarum]|nr:hypothetical protein [Candidatus Fournierella merdigallinarum]
MTKTRIGRWAALLACAVLGLVWAVGNSALEEPLQWDDPAGAPPAQEQPAAGWAVSQDLWLDAGSYALEWEEAAGRQAVVFAPDLLADNGQEGVQLNADGGPAFSVRGQRVRVQVWTSADAGPARLTSGLFCQLDGLFAVLVLAALAALLLARGPRTGAQKAALAVLVCCAVAASLPVLTPGIPYGPDLHFHLTRIQGIADGLVSGQFPVRIQPTPVGGKGYATSLLYPDLFLYPAALLRLAGVSLEGAYRATILALNALTAALAWQAGRRMLGSRFAALVFCVLYTLAPYRVCNLYVRAALGEALAMAFLPVVALGLWQLLFRETTGWPVLALGMTGIIQSHLISTIFCVAFGGLFCLLNLRRTLQKKRLLALVKAAGLALALNLWYILPWMRFSREDFNIFHLQFDVWDYALYPAQLFMTFGSVSGDAVRLGTLEGEMLLAPGLALLAAGGAMLLALGCAWQERAALPASARLGGWTAGFAGLSLWLCTTLFPWALIQKLPLVGEKLSVIQFPWRFLTTASLFLALCGGALAAWKLKGLSRQAKALALTAVFCGALLPSAVQMLQKAAEPPSYSRQEQLITDNLYDAQYLYTGTSAGDLIARPRPPAGGADLQVSGLSQRGNRLEFDFARAGGEAIELPLTWYPGYAAVDDAGRELACEKGDNGILTVRPQSDGGHLTVWYRGLWYFRLGDLVSLAAAAALAAGYAARRFGWRSPAHRRRKSSV